MSRVSFHKVPCVKWLLNEQVLDSQLLSAVDWCSVISLWDRRMINRLDLDLQTKFDSWLLV